jgi:hypothetical protein
MSSVPLISSEENIVLAPVLAAATAAFSANVDLPTPDCAATTVTLPGCIPDVSVSRSEKPYVRPTFLPFWMSSRSATKSRYRSPTVGRGLLQAGRARDDLGELLLDQVADFVLVALLAVGVLQDALRRLDDRAPVCLGADDLRVVRAVGGGGHGLDAGVQVRRAADLGQLPAFGQLGGDGDGSTGSPAACRAQIARWIVSCAGR